MTNPTYDVIIIGAGSIGVPAAWSMARSGVKVLVLDGQASPGQGSNKAAIGGIRATHSEPPKIRICLRSREIASSWQSTYGEDIEWTTGGYAFVAYGEKEATILKGLLESQQAHGLDIEWLDAEALRAAIPALNPAGLLGGSLSAMDGHCSPLLLANAMYRRAVEANAEFRFGEGVTAIDVRQGRVHGVITNRAAYKAPTVLNAAGAWASDVGRLVGLEHPITPDSHEAGITEPVAPFMRPMIVDIRGTDRSSNCYFFQLSTGQVLFSLTPRPLIQGTDCCETSAFLPMVSRRMIALVPRLSGLRVRRTWRGLYPMTPDGAPLVGWADRPKGYLMAIGMCGHGFMIGPGLGDVLDRLVRGDAIDEDRVILDGLSPDRSFDSQAALK
jgi:sarcosine oxidase, subunit beta